MAFVPRLAIPEAKQQKEEDMHPQTLLPRALQTYIYDP